MDSCPKELEPFVKAHEIKMKEQDALIYSWIGNYVLSAVIVAVDRCLSGRKSKAEYVKKPMLNDIEIDSLTEEERYEKELRKALLAEEMWIHAGKMKGLPETII